MAQRANVASTANPAVGVYAKQTGEDTIQGSFGVIEPIREGRFQYPFKLVARYPTDPSACITAEFDNKAHRCSSEC
jgi:hypothetical protein